MNANQETQKQNLVQVKRNANGRMSRYTPPAKVELPKEVRITAQEFLEMLRLASRVIPGMDRETQDNARQVAEKAAIECFLGVKGYDSSKLHAPQLDAAKRKAQFAAKR